MTSDSSGWKEEKLPWCAAELPDEGPIPLKDSSKMSPCTNTELWGIRVLQDRKSCLLSSFLQCHLGRQAELVVPCGSSALLGQGTWQSPPQSPVPGPQSLSGQSLLHRCWQILSETTITNLFPPPQQQLKKQVQFSFPGLSLSSQGSPSHLIQHLLFSLTKCSGR